MKMLIKLNLSAFFATFIVFFFFFFFFCKFFSNCSTTCWLYYDDDDDVFDTHALIQHPHNLRIQNRLVMFFDKCNVQHPHYEYDVISNDYYDLVWSLMGFRHIHVSSVTN